MERIGVRLVAAATVVLCVSACAIGVAPAAAAGSGQTIAQAAGVKLNASVRGSLYDSAFYSGYSVAFWTVSFAEGDRIMIRTKASSGATPPCQILYMPGTDDTNVSATTPILDPASATRDGSVDSQRWVATQTGSYVLAMTNADIFLSGPHQCLDAPAGRPFTFTVTVAHRGSGDGSDKKGGKGDGAASERSGGASTHVVEPGQSLWVIAQSVVGEPAGVAQVAFEVRRLWQLNAARIGTGNPDLIFPGQELRLK
jgi:nucleoid-associated protein YgaU